MKDLVYLANLAMFVVLAVLGQEHLTRGVRAWRSEQRAARTAADNFDWPSVSRHQIARCQAERQIAGAVQVLALSAMTLIVLILTNPN